MAGVREAALNFGPAGELVGIVSLADEERSREWPDLAVVIPNAGIIHRMGPNRVHVRLARFLASEGIPCFRIDLPGVGDSRTLGTSRSPQEEATAGLKAAFDLLERRRVASRFVVFGICSGANNAFVVACSDDRVVGIALVDPPKIFPTWKSELLRLGHGAARPVAWARLMAGRYDVVRKLFGRLRPRSGPSTRHDSPISHRDQKRFAREQLGDLVARGVRICYLTTDDVRREYKYRRQFLDAFSEIPLEPLTHTEILKGSHHTFPSEAGRRRLEGVLKDWLRDSWAKSTPDRARGPRSISASGDEESPDASDTSTRVGLILALLAC